MIIREDYDQIFDRFNATVREDVYKMLRTSCYSYFRKWDDEKIHAMAAAAKIKYFNYNRKVIKSGEILKEFFILRKGLIKIIKPVPKNLLLRSDEHVEVGLDGKVKRRLSAFGTGKTVSMMNRFSTNEASDGSTFLSQKLPEWVSGNIANHYDNNLSTEESAYDPALNPLIEGILPTDSNSEDEGSRIGPHSNRQQKLSRGINSDFMGLNMNSKSGESKSRLNTANTSRSGGKSTRGGKIMNHKVEDADEWFTVATLMPDQVLGEVSILSQIDKYLLVPTKPGGSLLLLLLLLLLLIFNK